jgi:hypothetical protein
MRLARYLPGELIPWPLSGSIPELPHVAKVGGGQLGRNNRITANQFLNRHCASGLDLESILLARMRKIFLQQYLPSADIPLPTRDSWHKLILVRPAIPSAWCIHRRPLEYCYAPVT